MNEIDAKKLRCIGPCPENTGKLKEIPEGVTPIMRPALTAKGPYYCSGSECMGWIPETKNLIGKQHLDGCEITRGGYCCYRKEG